MENMDTKSCFNDGNGTIIEANAPNEIWLGEIPSRTLKLGTTRGADLTSGQ